MASELAGGQGQAGGQTDRQPDWRTDRQTDRQIGQVDRETDSCSAQKQTDRQKEALTQNGTVCTFREGAL